MACGFAISSLFFDGALVICYASRTGTKRNLAVMREQGWRLLVSRAGAWRTECFPYALDNGAWSDFQNSRPFDEPAFEKLIEKLGRGADWIVLPDIVAGGLPSLELSVRWLNRCLSVCPLVLIAVQDGMTPQHISSLVGKNVGIFLGGSTEWKLNTAIMWGYWATPKGIYYHVARVNTFNRISLAIAAGADPIDGSNASRYSKNTARLSLEARQSQLFMPTPP